MPADMGTSPHSGADVPVIAFFLACGAIYGLVRLIAILSVWLRNRTLLEKTTELLNSGAEPDALVVWYDHLWERPLEYSKPAIDLIKLSSAKNARGAQALLRQRESREVSLSLQYGSLSICRPDPLQWPKICARCGRDLSSGGAAVYTAKAVRVDGSRTVNTTQTGSLAFPVCIGETCALDPDTTLTRPLPSFSLGSPRAGVGFGDHGSLRAHQRFLDAAKPLNESRLL